MSKFTAIPIGRIFRAGGEAYRRDGELTYSDLALGIQQYWTPLFDNTIEGPEGPGDPKPPSPSQPKFLTDPNTRVMKPNPEYKEPVEWFAEMWGSGLFDCGPEDYEFMAKTSIEWGHERQEHLKEAGGHEQKKK